MKKLTVSFLIILTILAFAACAAPEEPEVSTEPSATPAPTYDEEAAAGDDEGGEEFTQVAIGFSLAGSGAFYDQFIADIESECAGMNYRPEIKSAATAEEQIEHIHTMLSTGVSAIVIDPVDVDALESALAECETNHVPVINVVDSINGLVSTLISPDYISIGKSAGRDAVQLYGDSEGSCLLLKTNYDSFTMQLMTDGFNTQIGEDKDVSLAAEQFCSDDEDAAYAAVQSELSNPSSTVNFIFAQSDALGKGALRAIEELEADVKLTVFGGDMELIRAASEGKVHSCIFFGPKTLASESIFYADKLIKNENYMPPQYVELRIEAAEGDEALQYVADDLGHAQIIGE